MTGSGRRRGAARCRSAGPRARGRRAGRPARTRRERSIAAWWLESMRWKIGAALFLGCAELQPRHTRPREQCSPAGSADRSVLMSRSSSVSEKRSHSAASGACRLSAPWKSRPARRRAGSRRRGRPHRGAPRSVRSLRRAVPGARRQAGGGGAGLAVAESVVSAAIVGPRTSEELRLDLGTLSLQLDTRRHRTTRPDLARPGEAPREHASGKGAPSSWDEQRSAARSDQTSPRCCFEAAGRGTAARRARHDDPRSEAQLRTEWSASGRRSSAVRFEQLARR